MTILQALNGYYDRMAARGEVVSPGYTMEPIGFIVSLTEQGAVENVQSWRDNTGKKPRAEPVPKWFGRSGTGSTPYFLWDNTAYALGVSKTQDAKVERHHAAFKKLVLEKLANSDDPGLKALCLFMSAWVPTMFVGPLFSPEFVDQNVVFRLVNERLFIHDRPAARALVELLRQAGTSAENVQCLVTGKLGPLARLHPKIKGVSNTSVAEVPLVSYNQKSFESYNNENGSIAPTSEIAAFRYTTALNRLLIRSGSNRTAIGDATVVFWADTADNGPDAAEAAESVISAFFVPSPVEDADEAHKLRVMLEKVAKGRPISDLDPRLEKGTRFHVLGLSPNAARISIRFWLSDDFEVFVRRLGDHFADLAIEPSPWSGSPPAMNRLIINTLVPDMIRKSGIKKIGDYIDKNLPQISGELARAVLEGRAYPRAFLAGSILRLRAGDNPGTGWHIAAIKAVLARDQRRNRTDPNIAKKGETPVSLNREHPNTGYQLGRLFAIYELAQRSALGGRVNSTIRDKYFGAASAAPASIFPIIITNGQNHLAKVRKEKPGWAYYIERELEEVIGRIKPVMPFSLPRSLRLEDQGEFAIGYYHQRSAKLGDGKVELPDLSNDQEGNDDEQ